MSSYGANGRRNFPPPDAFNESINGDGGDGDNSRNDGNSTTLKKVVKKRKRQQQQSSQDVATRDVIVIDDDDEDDDRDIGKNNSNANNQSSRQDSSAARDASKKQKCLDPLPNPPLTHPGVIDVIDLTEPTVEDQQETERQVKPIQQSKIICCSVPSKIKKPKFRPVPTSKLKKPPPSAAASTPSSTTATTTKTKPTTEAIPTNRTQNSFGAKILKRKKNPSNTAAPNTGHRPVESTDTETKSRSRLQESHQPNQNRQQKIRGRSEMTPQSRIVGTITNNSTYEPTQPLTASETIQDATMKKSKKDQSTMESPKPIPNMPKNSHEKASNTQDDASQKQNDRHNWTNSSSGSDSVDYRYRPFCRDEHGAFRHGGRGKFVNHENKNLHAKMIDRTVARHNNNFDSNRQLNGVITCRFGRFCRTPYCKFRHDEIRHIDQRPPPPPPPPLHRPHTTPPQPQPMKWAQRTPPVQHEPWERRSDWNTVNWGPRNGGRIEETNCSSLSNSLLRHDEPKKRMGVSDHHSNMQKTGHDLAPLQGHSDKRQSNISHSRHPGHERQGFPPQQPPSFRREQLIDRTHHARVLGPDHPSQYGNMARFIPQHSERPDNSSFEHKALRSVDSLPTMDLLRPGHGSDTQEGKNFSGYVDNNTITTSESKLTTNRQQSNQHHHNDSTRLHTCTSGPQTRKLNNLLHGCCQLRQQTQAPTEMHDQFTLYSTSNVQEQRQKNRTQEKANEAESTPPTWTENSGENTNTPTKTKAPPHYQEYPCGAKALNHMNDMKASVNDKKVKRKAKIEGRQQKKKEKKKREKKEKKKKEKKKKNTKSEKSPPCNEMSEQVLSKAVSINQTPNEMKSKKSRGIKKQKNKHSSPSPSSTHPGSILDLRDELTEDNAFQNIVTKSKDAVECSEPNPRAQSDVTPTKACVDDSNQGSADSEIEGSELQKKFSVLVESNHIGRNSSEDEDNELVKKVHRLKHGTTKSRSFDDNGDSNHELETKHDSFECEMLGTEDLTTNIVETTQPVKMSCAIRKDLVSGNIAHTCPPADIGVKSAATRDLTNAATERKNPLEAIQSLYKEKPRYTDIQTNTHFIQFSKRIRKSWSHTSIFLCPLTHEAFLAGPYGGSDNYSSDAFNEGAENVCTLYWYSSPQKAIQAAAAQAWNCIMMREGKDTECFFEDVKPYWPYERPSWPINFIPQGVLDKLPLEYRGVTVAATSYRDVPRKATKQAPTLVNVQSENVVENQDWCRLIHNWRMKKNRTKKLLEELRIAGDEKKQDDKLHFNTKKLALLEEALEVFHSLVNDGVCSKKEVAEIVIPKTGDIVDSNLRNLDSESSASKSISEQIHALVCNDAVKGSENTAILVSPTAQESSEMEGAIQHAENIACSTFDSVSTTTGATTGDGDKSLPEKGSTNQAADEEKSDVDCVPTMAEENTAVIAGSERPATDLHMTDSENATTTFNKIMPKTVKPTFKPKKRKRTAEELESSGHTKREKTECGDDLSFTVDLSRPVFKGDTSGSSKDSTQSADGDNETSTKQSSSTNDHANIPASSIQSTERRYVFCQSSASSSKPAPPAGNHKNWPKGSAQHVLNTTKVTDPWYNCFTTQKQAEKEQEELFAAAAARMRTKAQARISYHPPPSVPAKKTVCERVFSAPIPDVHVAFPDHWRFKNLYSRLGLPSSATDFQIKTHYRQLARVYHPDKGGEELKFQEVTEAYNLLMNR